MLSGYSLGFETEISFTLLYLRRISLGFTVRLLCVECPLSICMALLSVEHLFDRKYCNTRFILTLILKLSI